MFAFMGKEGVDTQKPPLDSRDDFYKIISNPTRRRILLTLRSTHISSFSNLMKKIGMHPGHDTGSFNYHLRSLINSDLVSAQSGMYKLTQTGKRISHALPMEDEEYELLRLKPTQNETPVNVLVENREEEGMEIPQQTWKPRTIYFHESTHNTPARGPFLFDTFQVFCLDIHPVEYHGGETTGIEWLTKVYTPTYYGLSKYLDEGRIEVLRSGHFLDVFYRWTDILIESDHTETEAAVKVSQWSCRLDRELASGTPDPPRRLIHPPKRSHIYPINKQNLHENYVGEAVVTIGNKSYETLRVRYPEKSPQGQAAARINEDFLNEKGVAILTRDYLNKTGIKSMKLENWENSPTTIINNQKYYVVAETCLKTTATYG